MPSETSRSETSRSETSAYDFAVPEPGFVGGPVIAITQARMTSTRLPGKVLMEAAGHALLHHHLERLRACPDLAAIIVATTTNRSDDPLVAAAQAAGVGVFRGDEADVLGRFAGAAAAAGAGVVVRATADCPLLAPEVIAAQIACWRRQRHPRACVTLDVQGLPRGIGVEVFSRAALDEAAALAGPEAREHVTTWFYRHPERFPITVWRPENPPPLSEPVRWCVDEAADLALIRCLLADDPSPRTPWTTRLARYLANPAWQALNREVRQKEV